MATSEPKTTIDHTDSRCPACRVDRPLAACPEVRVANFDRTSLLDANATWSRVVHFTAFESRMRTASHVDQRIGFDRVMKIATLNSNLRTIPHAYAIAGIFVY